MKGRALQTAALAAVWTALAVADSSASGARFAADWGGILALGDLKIPIEFHISSASDGSLKATMDSPDLGASGLPAVTILEPEERIRLEVRSIGATFVGTLADSETNSSPILNGAWNQGGKDFPLSLQKGRALGDGNGLSPADLLAGKAAGDRFCGVWEGKVNSDPVQLLVWRAVNEIATGVLHDPARSAYNVPLTSIRFADGKLRFRAPELGAVFEGAFEAGGTVLKGDWVRAGDRASMELKKAAPPSFSRHKGATE